MLSNKLVLFVMLASTVGTVVCSDADVQAEQRYKEIASNKCAARYHSLIEFGSQKNNWPQNKVTVADFFSTFKRCKTVISEHELITAEIKRVRGQQVSEKRYFNVENWTVQDDLLFRSEETQLDRYNKLEDSLRQELAKYPAPQDTTSNVGHRSNPNSN